MLRALLVTSMLVTAARADGVITKRGHEVAAAHTHEEPCGVDDPTCATLRMRVLTGLSFGAVTGRLGAERPGLAAAGGIAVDGVSARYAFGSFHALRAEALRVPDHTAARLRFTLAHVDALFSCRDPDGELHPPISGQMFHACVPGSRLGIGGALLDVAADPATGRIAATWGRLEAVWNLLGATNAMAYLHGHVDVSIGIDAESIWHGDRDPRGGSDHVGRGIAGLAALWRSPGARWEIDASVEARPVLVGTTASLHDVGVVGEVTALYHLLSVGANAVMSTGIDVHADHWRDPAMAIGVLDPPTRTSTLFVGILLQVRHESPR